MSTNESDTATATDRQGSAPWPRHIILCTDLSTDRPLAAERALDLQRLSGAQLTVATNVGLQEREALESYQEVSHSDLERAGRVQHEAAMKAAGCTVEFASSFTHKLSASDGLVKMIGSTGADLVVCASHGRSGWRRLALGSVAEAITRRSPVPVLVVQLGPGSTTNA